MIVMRDLGDAVWTWDDHLSAATTRLDGRPSSPGCIARFLGDHAGESLVVHGPGSTVCSPLFAPHRIRVAAGPAPGTLATVALRGWELFAESVAG